MRVLSRLGQLASGLLPTPLVTLTAAALLGLSLPHHSIAKRSFAAFQVGTINALQNSALTALKTTSTAKPRTPSQLIKELNAEFGNLEGFSPIFILDHDELEARYVLAGVSIAKYKDKTDEIEKKRIAVIIDYVEEKTGITLKQNDASNLEMTHSLNAGASAYQWKENSFAQDKLPYLCTVIPPSYNLNEAQANMQILQLENKEIYPDHNFSHLTELMDREEAQLYSILHEIGHCLDRKYLPAMSHYEPSPSGVHQAEAFAEILGSLMMAQKGYTDIFERRAKYRMTYSWKLAPYFHSHPEMRAANPVAASGGTIYALHRPLRALVQWISQASNRQNIAQLTPPELIKVATEIVETYAFNSREFSAVDNYFEAEDKAAYFDRMEDYRTKHPDLFEAPIAVMQAYLELAPIVAAELISDESVRKDHTQTKVISKLNLTTLAEETLQSCQTKESEVRAFLGRAYSKLRATLFQYSGYDVTELNKKLTQAPLVAQRRLKNLGCIN